MERLTGELQRLQAEHARQGAEKNALYQQLSRVQGEEAATLVVDTERLRASYQEADELLLAKIDRASDQLHQALARERQTYDDLMRRSADIQAETARTQHRLDQLRGQVVHTEEAAMLQEAGIYEYRHPLADAVAYKSALSDLKDQVKTLARDNRAVLAATDWHVNGSLTEGRKMVRDFSKLMLRAYNAEADYAAATRSATHRRRLRLRYGRGPVQSMTAVASISTRCSGTSSAATPSKLAGGAGVKPSFVTARSIPSRSRGILSGVQSTT
ncbi:hypothetical protein H180DRAFT_04639 [Streptomyces sp. WMMB 322]|nr:hypothetical protein H180DRAFT_04639 [Streptomyces sp. WMMB 322]